MSEFNLDRELTLSKARLARRLDADVSAAKARIRHYTETERHEANLGLRPTERQAAISRAASGFEGLGKAWGTLLASVGAAAEAFNRGFANWDES